MKKAYLFLNGEPPSKSLVKKLDCESNFVACCDGAYNYLKNYLKPDLIVGDFDSIEDFDISKASDIEIEKFGAEKDYTDGYLAVKSLVDRGFTEIIILGATGGRSDHFFSNLILLSFCYEKGVRAYFLSNREEIHLVGGEFGIKTEKGKIISIVPFTDSAHIMCTKGLKYPACDIVMNKIHNLSDKNFVMGVSNVSIENEITLAIKSGLVLVFIEK